MEGLVHGVGQGMWVLAGGGRLAGEGERKGMEKGLPCV